MLRRVFAPQLFALSRSRYRAFSTSPWLRNNRAIVFSKTGDPAEVLSVASYPALPPPAPGTVNLRFLLAPINPSDVNVVEGVYPARPSANETLSEAKGEQVFVPGNEGLACVTGVGSGVSSVQEHDWVIMTKSQSGTWSTAKNVKEGDVLKVPRPSPGEQLTDVHLATLTVNPPTAYNILREFVKLEEGDWIVQNGANSAVGQAVIQVAASRGLKSLNFVRNRDNLSELVGKLEALGATKVLTYDDLTDKTVRDKIKEWTGGKGIKLGLNCVGGKETSLMARIMGKDSHLVSYGAMSKQPLSFPTSLFIFQNITSHGFWQNRWYQENTREKRQELVDALISLAREGKLKAPESEIVTLEAGKTDAEIEAEVKAVIKKISAGQHGKKVLLNIEASRI